MIRIIYYVMLIIGLYCLLYNNKSKIAAILITIGSFFIFAGNNLNSDYNMYLYSMMSEDYDRYEVGYRLYYSIFNMLGIKDYQITVIVTFIILGILVWRASERITDNYVVVLFLLLLSEMFIGTVQFRTMIASVLLFVAIVTYQYGKKRALLIAIISSTFQMVTIFFIPFFIIGLLMKDSWVIKEKGKYGLVIGAFCVYMVLLLLNNLLHINIPLIAISFLAHKWGAFEHVTYYFGGTAWGSLLFVGLYFMNLFTVSYLREHSKVLNNQYSEIIFNINIYAAFSLVLLFVDMNFYRIFRVLNLSNYVFIAWNLGLTKKRCVTIRYLKMIGAVCISQLFWIWNYLDRVPEIYNDIFKNNMWIG